MGDYEQVLQTRVDRKLTPLMRVIWTGFISAVIWTVMIIGMVTQTIDGQAAVAVGLLSFLLPALMGVFLSRETIKLNMIEQEEERMAELGLLEKRKHSEPERVGLSDDGELIDYYEDEARARLYSEQ